MKSGIGKRIVQRLNQFISKHVDIKKPATAIAMAICLLNGTPAHAEQHLNIYREQTTEQRMVGEGEEQTLANIHRDWEIVKPPRGTKDFTHSFTYLLIEEANDRSIMHLVYLGKSGDEHFFIGMRIFILIWNGDEVIIDKTINSLVGRNGLIKENIVDMTEVKHIPSPVKKFYDLTILSIKDIDMTDYAPVATAPYPDQGRELEMYSYKPEWKNNSLLGKRSCKAGRINSKHGYGYNNCLSAYNFRRELGSPVVDKQNRLVGLYLGQKSIRTVLTAFANLVPTKLGYLEMEGYAVDARDKIATTWGEIKQR